MGGKLWGLVPFILLIAGLVIMLAKNLKVWTVPQGMSTGLAAACLVLAAGGLCLYVLAAWPRRPRAERSGGRAQHRA